MKKLCIIYANCQNSLIAEYLNKSPYFKQEYSIKRFSVHILMAKGTTIPEQILKQAKLFIYQPVKDLHGVRSSKYLLNKLPSDCQQISFPSLYFKGYFPQLCKNPAIKIVKPNHPFGLIPHGDINIISMLKQGKSKAGIIKHLSDPNFYTSEFLISTVEQSLQELSERESQLEVKVSEFIKINYQHYRLFYTQNHPTDILGMYVVNQILHLLDLPSLGKPLFLINSKPGVLSKKQIPIYPSVIKHLCLSFIEQNAVYAYDAFATARMTLAKYISEYIELHNSTSESANSYYFKALKLVNNSQYEQAITAINKAIELKPDNANYYRELGSIYQKQRNLDCAEIAYRKGLELSPDWHEFYQLLGDILVKRRDLSSAISAYKQAVALNSDNAEYYRLLGNALFNENRLDEAQECFQKAIALEPTKAFLYRCLGDVYRQRNCFNLAVDNYKRAIELCPNVAYFYGRLSNILVKQNKLDEALTVCLQAIKIDDKNSNYYRTLGNIHLQIDNIDRAFDAYQQAIELEPKQMKRIFAHLGSLFKHKLEIKAQLELVKV